MSQIANTLKVVGYRDYIDPAQKDSAWVLEVVKELYDHGGAKNLLIGKRVRDIFDYAAGKHNMAKFNAMFPERKKKVIKTNNGQPNERDLANHTDILMDRQTAINLGMDLEPLGILQQPLASALATLQKGLVSINFTAVDATSNANRQMDLDRIRNRPGFEDAIGSAKLLLGMPLQAPGTKFNTPTVDISTMGLDPTKEDNLNVWANLFYKLRPESAFEVAVNALMDMTDFREKIDIQKRDQIYFAINTSKSYFSRITDMPDYDYVFPGHVYSPDSELPDFSDQPFRYIKKYHNVEQILNAVGKENITEEVIVEIFENYWKAAGFSDWQYSKASNSRKQQGIPLVYMEFKSFDVMRIARKKTKSQRMHVERVPFGYKSNSTKSGDPDDIIENKWPQQTYYAYWVPGTEYILKSGKVEGLFRAKGKENKSRFTIQIYKSKEKSDVEQCMTAVDDAQRAYIKMQLSVIMAKPKGVYIDMKYLRKAAETVAADLGMTIDDLVTLMFVKNVMLGDTEDMDGTNEGNFPPFREIPGGLGQEVAEYLAIIQDASKRIAQLTGFNDALTGQTPNPDQLVGIQKLLLQSSLNSLHYAQKAIKKTVENVVLGWAPMIQFICNKSNKDTQARKALENIIGSYKIDIIQDMDSLSVTQFGLLVEDAPDEQAQAELRQLLYELLRGQRIELSDFFLVRRVMNYKDAEQILVMKESQKAKKNEQMEADRNNAIRESAQIHEQGAGQRLGMQIQGNLQQQQLKNAGQEKIENIKSRLQVYIKETEADLETRKKAMQGQQAQDKQLQKHNLENLSGVTV
jgi:hypothetical protein